MCTAWAKPEMPVQMPKGKMEVTLLGARVLQGSVVVEGHLLVMWSTFSVAW